MSAVLETIPQKMSPPPFPAAAEEILYPDSHEDDMGESSLHYELLAYLWNALRLLFRHQADVCIAANMNLYYEAGRPELYFTPDVMVAFGVAESRRRVYKLWEEQVFPQVIIEVASDRTWRNDLSDKVEFYGNMGAEEYYVLDTEDFLPVPLMAYRQENGRLNPIYLPEDRAHSPRLGVEIRLTENGFRFFNPATQEFVRTLEEAEDIAADEATRAAAEATRAVAAEAEIARLRAELAVLRGEKQ